MVTNEESRPGSDDAALEDDRDEDPFAYLDPVRDATLIRWLEEADKRDAEKSRRARLSKLAASVQRRRKRPANFGAERGAPPLAVRLPRWLDGQVRRAFAELGVTPSEGVRQILEEWCVARLYPVLEYRDEEFLRLAAIRGGPGVKGWLNADGSMVLPAEVREQVEDYVELCRSRLEVELGRSF